MNEVEQDYTSEVEQVTSELNPDDASGEGLMGVVEVQVDEQALKAGFEYPFTLVFKPMEKAKKGDLLKEIVSTLMQIPEQPPSYRQAFKRWVCKNFNVAEAIFNDPTTLGEELSMVEQNLNLKSEAKPYVTEQTEPVEQIEVGTGEDEKEEPDFVTLLGM